MPCGPFFTSHCEWIQRVLPSRLDDAVALRIAAGAARRLGVAHARAILGVDALDRLVVVGRAAAGSMPQKPNTCWSQRPFAGRDLALPDAEPAELLRGVEQLVLARRARGQRALARHVGERPDDAAGDARRVDVDPERLARRAAQLQHAAVGALRAEHAANDSRASEPALPGIVKSSKRRRRAGRHSRSRRRSARWPRRSCRSHRSARACRGCARRTPAAARRDSAARPGSSRRVGHAGAGPHRLASGLGLRRPGARACRSSRRGRA